MWGYGTMVALRLNDPACALKNDSAYSDYFLFYFGCFDQYDFLVSIVYFWLSLFIVLLLLQWTRNSGHCKAS